MWNRLRKEIAVELSLLNHLLQSHHALLSKCEETEPTIDELAAIAAVVHSFYTGIEAIFKRIAVEMDSGPPRGGFWHSDLLESIAKPSRNRPAVISQETRDILEEYLDFRHVFRHAYTFELRWKKVAPLVLGMESVLRKLEEEIARFLSAIEGADKQGAGESPHE